MRQQQMGRIELLLLVAIIYHLPMALSTSSYEEQLAAMSPEERTAALAQCEPPQAAAAPTGGCRFRHDYLQSFGQSLGQQYRSQKRFNHNVTIRIEVVPAAPPWVTLLCLQETPRFELSDRVGWRNYLDVNGYVVIKAVWSILVQFFRPTGSRSILVRWPTHPRCPKPTVCCGSSCAGDPVPQSRVLRGCNQVWNGARQGRHLDPGTYLILEWHFGDVRSGWSAYKLALIFTALYIALVSYIVIFSIHSIVSPRCSCRILRVRLVREVASEGKSVSHAVGRCCIE